MESSQSRTPPPTILPSAYRLHYSFILSPSLLSLSTSRPYSCDPPLIGHPNSKFSRKRIESSAHTPNSITCDHGAEPLSTDMASGTVARGGIQVPKRGGLVDPGIHATASRSYREHETKFHGKWRAGAGECRWSSGLRRHVPSRCANSEGTRLLMAMSFMSPDALCPFLFQSRPPFTLWGRLQ